VVQRLRRRDIFLVVIFVLSILITCLAGRDSVATRYGLDRPGIESRWGRDFPHPSRSALGSTHPRIQWAPCLPAVKRPERGVNHPLTSSAEVKERVELYLYSPSDPLWPVQGELNFHHMLKPSFSFCSLLPGSVFYIIPSVLGVYLITVLSFIRCTFLVARVIRMKHRVILTFQPVQIFFFVTFYIMPRVCIVIGVTTL
jgi:hypothetical protein